MQLTGASRNQSTEMNFTIVKNEIKPNKATKFQSIKMKRYRSFIASVNFTDFFQLNNFSDLLHLKPKSKPVRNCLLTEISGGSWLSSFAFREDQNLPMGRSLQFLKVQ